MTSNESKTMTLADAMFAASLKLARLGGAIAKNRGIWMPPADRQRALAVLARLERQASRRRADLS